MTRNEYIASILLEAADLLREDSSDNKKRSFTVPTKQYKLNDKIEPTKIFNLLDRSNKTLSIMMKSSNHDKASDAYKSDLNIIKNILDETNYLIKNLGKEKSSEDINEYNDITKDYVSRLNRMKPSIIDVPEDKIRSVKTESVISLDESFELCDKLIAFIDRQSSELVLTETVSDKINSAINFLITKLQELINKIRKYLMEKRRTNFVQHDGLYIDIIEAMNIIDNIQIKYQYRNEVE